MIETSQTYSGRMMQQAVWIHPEIKLDGWIIPSQSWTISKIKMKVIENCKTNLWKHEANEDIKAVVNHNRDSPSVDWGHYIRFSRRPAF